MATEGLVMSRKLVSPWRTDQSAEIFSFGSPKRQLGLDGISLRKIASHESILLNHRSIKFVTDMKSLFRNSNARIERNN